MKVRVKLVDLEPLVENRGPRVCTVRIDDTSFETPVRALSSQEARAYMRASVVIEPLRNHVYEHVEGFNATKLKQISRKNGVLSEEISRINTIKSKHDDKYTLFFPIRDSHAISLEPEDMLGVIDLQILGGFDLVSIPDFWSGGMSLETVAKKIDNLYERVGMFGKQGIPYIDMQRDESEFAKLLELLLERDYPILGLEYANMLKFYPAFRKVAERARGAEKTLFHMSHTDPTSRGDLRVSPSMFATLFGIDSICVAVRPPKGGSTPKTVDPIKRFSPHTAGVLSKVEYEKDGLFTKSDCGCPVCSGMTVRQFYETYSHRPAARSKDKIDPSYLRSVSKVHEVFSIDTELNRMRKLIRELSFKKEYLEKKEDLMAARNAPLFK